jgi:hypothetical protein
MTDMHKGGGQILKTDTRGRVRTPKERREGLLDEFERSGLSGAKFAALTGIKYQTFAAWALRRRKGAGSKVPARGTEAVHWLEAVAAPMPASGGPVVVVQLPGGGRVELHELQQVALTAALLRTLAQPC